MSQLPGLTGFMPTRVPFPQQQNQQAPQQQPLLVGPPGPSPTAQQQAGVAVSSTGVATSQFVNNNGK